MNKSIFIEGRIRRALTALLVSSCAVATLRAAGDASSSIGVESLSLHPGGAFTFDGLEVTVIHYTPEWSAAVQTSAEPKPGFPKKVGSDWETEATLATRGKSAPFILTEKLVPEGPHAFAASYGVEVPEGIATQELALQVSLQPDLSADRPLLVDGKEVILPPAFVRRQILEEPIARERTLVFPSASGSVEVKGVFSFLVQDQRQWKPEGGYAVRLRFALPAGGAGKTELKTAMRHFPWRSEPLSLKSAANRGFADEVANDRKGGWTDQGAVNDLAGIPHGILTAAGVRFEIIDPASNDAKAAVVLGSKDDEELPKSVSVPVTGSPVWRNLYLLHAGAWLPADGVPVGAVRVRYTDGTESVSEVKARQDVGNWWSPTAMSNGTVGWTGANPSSEFIGLHVSRFPLEEKPVEHVTLEGTGAALWMVAGISGSPDDLKPYLPVVPFEAAPGPDWAPYEYSIEIEPGGVFDFSFLADAPAGKYGPITVTPGGHFEFADRPGQRVRFWGVNLCFSANYLEPEESEMLAKRLAASGYNTVRIHHYDRDLAAKGKPSYELDPAQLARLDALFAAMKRHGLYINLDLYTSRKFTEEEMAILGIDPEGEVAVQFKALVPISEAAFENWKQYTTNLLTHKNPHTGMTWAEDPALIGICPVNEDPLDVWIGRAPAARKLYEKAFVSWWDDAANRSKAGDDREAGFSMFLHEKQMASDARMKAYIREIGAKTPVTGVNFHNEQALTFVREHYDYVDNHQYWDHPEFPEKKWSAPFRFAQGSAVRSAALAPRDLMAARIWGKPYVITEFNFVRPNRYRAEGGVYMPAYASLQDWDGLYNFDYASHRESILKGGTAGTFSIANDPIGLLADRVSALIFRRGDVLPGKNAIGYAVSSPEAFSVQEKNFPPVFSRLALLSRIGSGTGMPEEELKRHNLNAVVVGPGSAMSADEALRIFKADGSLIENLEAADILPPDSVDANGSRFVSDTGQIELRSKEGAMKVVTPRSELFVLPGGQELQGDVVSVKNGQSFGTVSVVSVDGNPLASSDRFLVMHLTDALAKGMKFAGQDRRLLLTRGALPHLIQAGGVEVKLRLDPAKSWRAWAVDTTGKRVREIPMASQDGVWTLSAQTVTGKDVQLAYEIAAAPKE